MPPASSPQPSSPGIKFSSVRSFSSLETSSWKCRNEGSASRAKFCRFSIALLNLAREKAEERLSPISSKDFDRSKAEKGEQVKAGEPVVNVAGSLHKAGLVRFLQQLLCEGHQARVLHQTAPLCHLGSQRLAAPLPRGLQGLGERSVALGQRGRQVPDALGQLLSGGHAVHLRIGDRAKRFSSCFCGCTSDHLGGVCVDVEHPELIAHLRLSDGTLQLGNLSQDGVLVGQNVVHLLSNLLLSSNHTHTHTLLALLFIFPSYFLV